ncbi:SDR family NAD(P)-dependent oxidoreductase [Alphaproteobacteria bacterium]|nr:SDR family NAD(P)-dependent oxidoreductase [Alphaproteobacteria bacterium]
MKMAIVTGAARGIGLATAWLFVDQGYQVAMVDRDGDALDAAAASLAGSTAFVCDVSDPVAVDEMVAAALAVSERIDCLVNNAGVADFCSIEDTSFERWRIVIATNLDGVYLCSQSVLAAPKESRGSIVNIALISGLCASTLRVAYGTLKVGAVHLTQQFAAKMGEFGIRVNCVPPGPVCTKLVIAVHSQAIIDAYHDTIPLNRYGGEAKIAEVIAFLGSEKASYITGQTLAVDVGFDSTGVGLPALRV